MGVSEPGMQAAEQPSADALLTALRTVKPAERARHAEVLDYWLSIRGSKEFPPLHDLDPLQISGAGPSSILLELIGGGQDAAIRHLGEDLAGEVAVEQIIDAPNPSILACIARKLPIVAISRDFLSFEDSFDHSSGWTRLWVTLLPLSSCGSWVDYVYAFVSVETGGGKAARPVAKLPPAEDSVAEVDAVAAEVLAEGPVGVEPETPVGEAVQSDSEDSQGQPEEPTPGEPIAEAPAPEPEPAVDEEPVETQPEATAPERVATDAEIAVEPEAEPEPEPEPEQEPGPEPDAEDEVLELDVEEAPQAELPTEQADDEAGGSNGPGFSKILEGIAQLAGFYGQGVKVDDPVIHTELPPVDGPAHELAAEEAEPVAEAAPEPQSEAEPEAEPASQSEAAPVMEGHLQNMLAEVRAKADEANQARIRAVVALHEGLSAAYDFALDAESSPEEYLRLVEAQGLKIQLRAPMAPVAKLAFAGSCEPQTIAAMEKVLAWALKEELPRGALLDRISEAGGIAELAQQVTKG